MKQTGKIASGWVEKDIHPKDVKLEPKVPVTLDTATTVSGTGFFKEKQESFVVIFFPSGMHSNIN